MTSALLRTAWPGNCLSLVGMQSWGGQAGGVRLLVSSVCSMDVQPCQLPSQGCFQCFFSKTRIVIDSLVQYFYMGIRTREQIRSLFKSLAISFSDLLSHTHSGKGSESQAEGWTVSKHLTQGKIDMEVINKLSDSLTCPPSMEL